MTYSLYDVGNTCPGLRQTQICPGVKPVHGISDHIMEPAPFNNDFREPFTCLFLPFKMLRNISYMYISKWCSIAYFVKRIWWICFHFKWCHNGISILNLIVNQSQGILQVLVNMGCGCEEYNYVWMLVCFVLLEWGNSITKNKWLYLSIYFLFLKFTFKSK